MAANDPNWPTDPTISILSEGKRAFSSTSNPTAVINKVMHCTIQPELSDPTQATKASQSLQTD